MGILLIVLGAVLIISGLFTLNKNNESNISLSDDIDGADNISLSVTDGHFEGVAEQGDSVSGVESVRDESVVDSEPKEVMAPKEKGDAFEDFVVNLLADWRLKLLDRTQDKVSSAGVFAESCMNPDLHVQQKRGESNIDYYIECKYRSRWKDGEVAFDDLQFNRYRKFQRDNHRKVIIALGVGGSPSAPATFMLVPLDSIKNNVVKKVSTGYCINPSSTDLVEYMDTYFSKVFSKAKHKPAND